MSDQKPETGSGEDKSLLLDDIDEKFAAFQAFRKSDTEAADGILTSLGAQDDVDRDIVLEVSAPRPLGHPRRFEEAHRLAVRALEVLDRNGARSVRVSGLGPLNPVAAFLAQQVAQFIVRSHQAAVTDEMLRLYSRREANAAFDDPSRPMLMLARIQMQRLSPGFKRNALGAAAFLVGGAAVSWILNLVAAAARAAIGSLVGKIIATIVLGLLVVAIAWVVLRGAAVARRRIQLTLDQPINALWQTIGRCGTPPRDPSRVFGLIAIILAAIPWILIPIGLLLSWLTG